MILRTHHLSKKFGGIVALDDVSLEFRPGSVTALVGSNGAGKSTLFNVIGGLIAPDSGEVTLGNGNEIRLNGLPGHAIARHGVGRLFQDVKVFRQQTALENVAVGAQNQPGERPILSLLRSKAVRAREREVQELARQHLEFVGLADKAHLWAGQLSYGEQKLVAIARLLAADAHVLLLDEPTAGVHSERINQLLDRIQRLAEDHNRTVIMIEHNRDVMAQISDHVYRLEAGRIVPLDAPQEQPNITEKKAKRHQPRLHRPATAPVLELNDTHAAYQQKEILHGISLTVHAGEIVALLGENGSGKSTSLKVIEGLLSPSQGIISYNGVKINSLDVAERQRLGIARLWPFYVTATS